MSLLLTTALLFAAAPPEVALLCTAPQEPWTELRFQPLGASSLARAATRLPHVGGESVQGAVLPGRRAVVAVAVAEPSKDLSFASHLFLLAPGAPPRDLADRVLLGARPWVTARGRVFVARGRAGALDFDARERLRLDDLSLDEVDARADAGKAARPARTVFSFTGYALFPVGEWRGALVVYAVSPQGGALLAVHPDALGVTRLSQVPPLARDFALDEQAGALYFTQGAADGAWEVHRLALDSGALEVLARGESMALLPTLFPGGAAGSRLARSLGPGRGLGTAGPEGPPLLAAQGEGHDRVRAFARGGEVAVGLNERPDGSATPFAVEWKTGQALPLRAPPGLRLDVAGVVEP